MILLLSLGLIYCNSWAEMGTSFATSRPSLEKPALENLNLRQRSEGKKSQDLPEVPKTPSLHLFKNPDLLIQKESLKNQKKLEGGEWGSSGGGSGVACFKNPSLAQEAQAFVTQNVPLPIPIVDKIEIQKNLYIKVKMNKICPQDGGHCFEGIEKSLSLQFGPMSSQTSGNTSDGSFSLTLSDSKLVVTGTCIPSIGGQ